MTRNILILLIFLIVLFVDVLIRKGYLGKILNKYYLKFVELPYISIYFLFLMIFLIIFTLLGYLNIAPGAAPGALFLLIEDFYKDLNINSSFVLENSGENNINTSNSNSTINSISSNTNNSVNSEGSTNNNLNNNNTAINPTNNNKNNNVFVEYPWNFLPEMDKLLSAELIFLTIILNISIGKYLTSLDYNKYIPNNKFGIILAKLINRYITIWTKSASILIKLSWIMIFLCVIILKLSMFVILNSK